MAIEMANVFSRSLPLLLHRTMQAVMPPFREIFADHDLTDQQWRVLRAMWELDRLSMVDLAAATVLPAPSLVGIVDRLEKRGLVSRIRSESDRRLVYLVATDQGRALYADVEPRISAIHDDLRARATNDEWAELDRILTKIADGAPAAKTSTAA
ncbi:MAG: MarR family transcriptional regulator [Pseudomonadota bacterium]